MLNGGSSSGRSTVAAASGAVPPEPWPAFGSEVDTTLAGARDRARTVADVVVNGSP